jgi:hypothetical protein
MKKSALTKKTADAAPTLSMQQTGPASRLSEDEVSAAGPAAEHWC